MRKKTMSSKSQSSLRYDTILPYTLLLLSVRRVGVWRCFGCLAEIIFCNLLWSLFANLLKHWYFAYESSQCVVALKNIFLVWNLALSALTVALSAMQLVFVFVTVVNSVIVTNHTTLQTRNVLCDRKSKVRFLLFFVTLCNFFKLVF